jgi:VWFA-related protein
MLRAGLGRNDHVCIFTASATQVLDCTNQAASLEQTIERIHNHPQSGGDKLSCPKISPYEAARIAVYNDTLALDSVWAEAKQCELPVIQDIDGVKAESEIIWSKERAASYDILQSLRQATQYLSRQLGQRALLLASDGFIDDELGGVVETISQEALRNDVVINSLEAKGMFSQDPARPFSDATAVVGALNNTTFEYEEQSRMPSEWAAVDALASLAQGTGGYFFHNSNDLTLGFKQLASSPAIAYQLGFPMDAPRDGKFHTLKVELLPHRKYVTVQARPGYFAPIPGISVGEFFTAMDNAMRGNDERSEVPATLAIAQHHQEIDLTAAFNVAKLPFIEHLGRADQKLIITAALFDSRGQLAEGKRGELDMWLLPATRRRLNTEGLQTRLTLYTDRPGTYRLRVVVGESTDARLATFNQELQVH